MNVVQYDARKVMLQFSLLNSEAIYKIRERVCSQRPRKVIESGGANHGEPGARAYNGGLGAKSPAGSRGRAPGQGVSWNT